MRVCVWFVCGACGVEVELRLARLNEQTEGQKVEGGGTNEIGISLIRKSSITIVVL